MTRQRPRARRWTLERLDREQTYRLVFDHAGQRWDLMDEAGVEVVTRDPEAQTRARRERAGRAGPSPATQGRSPEHGRGCAPGAPA